MARRISLEAVSPTKQKRIPFAFVLDELARLRPETRPMFGCTAVYIGPRIVLVLRDKGGDDADGGVWVSFQPEALAWARSELPILAPISVFGSKVSSWMKLPMEHPQFEESVMRVCELLSARDPRLGKVPGEKKKPAAKPRKKHS